MVLCQCIKCKYCHIQKGFFPIDNSKKANCYKRHQKLHPYSVMSFRICEYFRNRKTKEVTDGV